MSVWRLSKISCPRLPQSVPCEAADAGEGGELGQEQQELLLFLGKM